MAKTEKDTIKEIKQLCNEDLLQIKSINQEDRTIIGIATTENPDRYNEVVIQDGMDTTNFMKNPVLALGHSTSGDALPVGKVLRLWREDNKTLFEAQFPDEGINKRADDTYKMIKAGYLNAFSIGFRILEPPQQLKDGTILYPTTELLEISCVMVGAHQEALTIVRSYFGEEKKEEKTVEVTEDKMKLLVENMEVLKEYRSILKDMRDVTEVEVIEEELEQMKSVFDKAKELITEYKKSTENKSVEAVTQPKELDLMTLAEEAADNILKQY